MIVCAAAYTKNGREAEQPIPDALADVLRPWVASMPPAPPRLRPADRTADMIRADLAAAGVEVETASGVIDFHALRGCYISPVVSSGASVKTARRSHGTPRRSDHRRLRQSVGPRYDQRGRVPAEPDAARPTIRYPGRDGDRPESSCYPIRYPGGR